MCGKEDAVSSSSVIALRYVSKGLSMSREEIDRIRALELDNLLGKRKLYLVLDLDHTLLHTVSPHQLSATEEYLLLKDADSKRRDVLANGSLFWSSKHHRLTKLRPFVRTFLQEASHLFDLCIYTMGCRSYAKKMARLLDPHKDYFDFRVISRHDCTRKRKKGLDVVLADQSTVVIVDDTESVWDQHHSNLIPIDKYYYFSESNAPLSADDNEETDSDDALVHILEMLKNVHHKFFNDPSMGADVRNVLRAISQGTW